MNQRQWNLGIVLVGLVLFERIAFSGEALQPVSISAEHFGQMSDPDRKMLLIRVFERRLDHAKNLYYEVDTVFHVHKSRNGEPGEQLADPPSRIQYQQWCLGKSYRVHINRYREPELDKVDAWMVSGFDADEGVRRSTARGSELKGGYGRVDTKPDSMIYSDQYRYWLDGDKPHWKEFLFRYLLSRKDEFQIEVPAEGDKVRLTVGYQPSWANEAGGKRMFLLDPRKGFLPIQGASEWSAPPSPSGQPNWRVEKFTVQDSQLVGDVWMPIRMRSAIAASSDPTGNFAVYDMTVSKIEYDKVTRADLVVPFTEGMEVVDTVKGVSYTAGADGKPRGTVVPLGLPPASK